MISETYYDMVFQNEKNLFQKRVNELIKTDPMTDLISDLIHLSMLKNCEKDEKQLVCVELYNLLGPQKFMEMIDICNDKTIKFPNKEVFKESIQTALCYYYRNYKNYSWEQIKELLEDQELQTIKIGVKIHNLKMFIDEFGEKLLHRKKRKT